jgi:hypothetical protein
MQQKPQQPQYLGTLPESIDISGQRIIGHLVAMREFARKDGSGAFYTVRLGGVVGGDAVTRSPMVDIPVDADTYQTLSERAEDIVGSDLQDGTRQRAKRLAFAGFAVLNRQTFTSKANVVLASYSASSVAPGKLSAEAGAEITLEILEPAPTSAKAKIRLI